MIQIKILTIARIKKDITQKELAEALNMSPSTINRIENGIKPIDSIKIGTLKKICKALDISVEEFITLLDYN